MNKIIVRGFAIGFILGLVITAFISFMYGDFQW